MIDVRRRSEDLNKRSGVKIDYGPYIGVVVGNEDSLFSGRLQVWIASFGGNSNEKTSWHTVSYANPFYGITPHAATDTITGSISASAFRGGEGQYSAGYLDNKKRRRETKSFGMWTQPPDIGTRVLVVFADGHPDKGFWIAAIPEVAHAMIPGIGKGRSGQPEAEFDPSDTAVHTSPDIRTVPRPPLPDIAARYEEQGILKDPVRGLISTSSLRESPSRVMGFSTPEGHSFVMDDGTKPQQQGQDGSSKLIRIRTKQGNQITLNDDTGMLYFINANGKSWMELSGDGQIDVYGEKGISFATNGDINFHADKEINIHSNSSIKAVAQTGMKLQGTSEMQLHGKKTMISGVDSIEMHSCGELKITSFKDVFIKGFNFLVAQAKCFRWNSGTALEAEQVPPEKTNKVSGYETTVVRAPSHEPYDGHFNGNSQQAQQGALSQEQAAIQANNTAEARSNAVGGGGPSPTGGEPSNTTNTSTGRGTSAGNPGSSLQSYGGSTGRQNVATTATSLAQNAQKYSPAQGPRPVRPGQAISGITPGPTLGGNVEGPNPSSAQPPSTSITQESNGIVVNMARPDYISNNSVGPGLVTKEADAPAPGPMNTLSPSAPQTGKSLFQAGPLAGATDIPLQTGGINSNGTKANPALASQQLGGFGPATSIPAAPGGGSTAGFAKGDNCARPTGTGAGQGGTQGQYAPGGKADPVKEQEMYDYLTKEKGLSHEQAVGMIANIRAESAYKSDAVGDNGNSIGLFQYNAPAGRAGPFEAAVPDWRTNWKGQIDYALTNDPVGRQYANTKFESSQAASNFWVQKFEIPADIPGQMGVRAANAGQIDSTIKRG